MRHKINEGLIKKASGVLAFVLLLSVFFIVSCAKKQTVRTTEIGPYSGPVNIEILKKNIGFGNISSIRSLVDVRVFKKGKSAGSFNGAFAYKAPGSMRISLFGPFGLTLLDVLITKDVLQAYLPPKNILYEWESPDISLNSLADDRSVYKMKDENNEYVLFATKEKDSDSEVRARYIFDKTYILNRYIIFYKDGDEFIRIDFDDFKGSVPGRTRIASGNKSALEISLNNPDFDTEVPAEYFSPVEHGDKKVLPLQDILNRFDSIR